MKKLQNSSGTPYDDVCRTLLIDCSSLILPIVNEIFQRNHPKTEKIVLLNNFLFITSQDGKQVKRVTDSNFMIGTIRYHIECQSSNDGTMLLRVFEYDSQLALQDSELTEYTKRTVIDMSKKVLEQIAKKYSNVKEGVGEIMGGKVLDYEAKDILNAGRAEGMATGRAVECIENILDVLDVLGDVSGKLRETILTEQDLDVLKGWFKIAIKSKTVEEFQEKISE